MMIRDRTLRAVSLFAVGSAALIVAASAAWTSPSVPGSTAAVVTHASRSDDPTLRLVGHYEGTGPQIAALRVKDPTRGRAPAGADTAILAYSGISVKMLVDRTFGADHTTMFTVDYEIGGSAQQHDHPFEEAYLFLAGEVEGEMDGQTYTFRPGDWAFAPVGSVHGFYNTGSERVRWLETQAPQPPARNSYRWGASWEKYAERLKAR